VSRRYKITSKMSKKRTRKQKESARHKFVISWVPDTKEIPPKSNVKRQLEKSDNKTLSRTKTKENIRNKAKVSNLASIKKDIVKSLILASLILASELVLYLLWKT